MKITAAVLEAEGGPLPSNCEWFFERNFAGRRPDGSNALRRHGAAVHGHSVPVRRAPRHFAGACACAASAAKAGL